MVTSCALAISFFDLHFTQYASATVRASPPVQFSTRKTCGGYYNLRGALVNSSEGGDQQGDRDTPFPEAIWSVAARPFGVSPQGNTGVPPGRPEDLFVRA